MTENKPISKSRDTLYRVVIILIVAVAAYSNATKELNRLQEMVGGAHEFTEAGLGGLARVYGATRSLSESSRLSAEWPDAIEFKKAARILALDRASTTSNEVEVEIFKREISPDVQLHAPVKVSYKFISGESEMSDSN